MSSGELLRASVRPLDLTRSHGDFVQALGTPFDSYDPTTGEVVATVSSSTFEDVERAVERARSAARTNRSWARDGALRGRVLQRFALALRRQADGLAELLVREQGKTRTEALSEVASSASMVEYYAGLSRWLAGRALPFGDEVDGMIFREPMGVVAVITPWNWPITLLVRSLAPALAAGNMCVVKPASLTPAITVEVLALLAADEELPEGAVVCILGPGATVGDALVGSAGVDMVAFTGESKTGESVMQRAAVPPRKVALELGGKSANVVFADASMDKALAGAQNAIFTTSGQICTAGSRLLVERRIHDEFVDRLVELTGRMRVGDGLDPETDMGPLVSRAQVATVLEYVTIAREQGTILCGGEVLDLRSYPNGNFFAPTIVVDLPRDSRVLREEIFGPVLCVQPFDSVEEAIELANDTDFGLAAGLWTQDLDRAFRVIRHLRAGTIWVNTYHHFYAEAEDGGFKKSGVGRQQGVDGLYAYTETKHVSFSTTQRLW
ncbi:MAG: aldehyde dehydrogenase family protein [Actinomycetota bacterium]|nr:aldehyde dehydrogenase family protein [Actinomycetota bacterium]